MKLIYNIILFWVQIMILWAITLSINTWFSPIDENVYWCSLIGALIAISLMNIVGKPLTQYVVGVTLHWKYHFRMFCDSLFTALWQGGLILLCTYVIGVIIRRG